MAKRRQRNLGMIEVDDPWGTPANPDGTLAVEAKLTDKGWTPPNQLRMHAPIKRRDNPLGWMFHKHQIDRAQYLAGCEYQRAYALSQIGGRSSLLQMRVDGGQLSQPVSDRQMFFANRKRNLEKAVLRRCGTDGLSITQDVLLGNKTTTQSAIDRSATDHHQIRSWSWMFRRCLNVMAERLGYAAPGRKPANKPNMAPENDPAYRARDSELSDPNLRKFDKRATPRR